MKKRRVGRKGLQEKRRQRRLYPYTEKTMLYELIDRESDKDLSILLGKLSPYLIDGEGPLQLLNRLYFDLERIKGKRQFIICELAIFLDKVRKAGTLRIPQSVFFRYLSSPEHCNLGISENSLKALILGNIPKNN